MIGLDTNVIVQYLMRDDALQSKQAQALINSLSVSNPGFVSLVVIVELFWFLSYVFQLSQSEASVRLSRIARMSEFKVEKAAVLFRALHLCDTTNAEFVDSLIFSLAKQAGCSAIVTFDRKAAKALGMQRIV
ncbi:PIN domain-containing protein [Duganella sp. BuS-21]|uniref:PIN domain-containing protein n=1 Tax=Duganella sp. BuS-21 TaxID=2943848 RepID=UPI0035A5881E